MDGYYGDAKLGTADSCEMCACPLATPSNNFGTSCALGADGLLGCSCKEGYSGPRCGTCADGYYGDPSVPGDYCKRCDCNGNIDPNVAGSCDPATGKCLKCINGATGDKCERCVEGYYGDAVDQKNCTKCRCDACGAATALCDTVTGACACKPNVTGPECDQCKVSGGKSGVHTLEGRSGAVSITSLCRVSFAFSPTRGTSTAAWAARPAPAQTLPSLPPVTSPRASAHAQPVWPAVDVTDAALDSGTIRSLAAKVGPFHLSSAAAH